ncbi:hypothetical protein vseg_010127 [Gypsophila vaccaria]
MEENVNKNHRKTLTNDNRRSSAVNRCRRTISGGGDGGGAAWETLNSGIEKVQALLDQNRALIRQVKENHESKIPDNLSKNVGLINGIDRNIRQVVSIYADISVNFTSVVRQRKAKAKAKAVSSDRKAEVDDDDRVGSGVDDDHR